MKKLLNWLFPIRMIIWLDQQSHHNYIDGRWYSRSYNFSGRRWPKMISRMLWVNRETHSVKLCGKTDNTKLQWPGVNETHRVDVYQNVMPQLIFEGFDIREWLLENCTQEFACRLHFKYFAGWANPVVMHPADAIVHVEFVDPHDAMVFKLVFQ